MSLVLSLPSDLPICVFASKFSSTNLLIVSLRIFAFTVVTSLSNSCESLYLIAVYFLP